jgi:hypothetical protein
VLSFILFGMFWIVAAAKWLYKLRKWCIGRNAAAKEFHTVSVKERELMDFGVGDRPASGRFDEGGASGGIGSGAIGFEAISRGAVRGVFCERHFPTADLIGRSAKLLDILTNGRYEPLHINNVNGRIRPKYAHLVLDPDCLGEIQFQIVADRIQSFVAMG